MINEKRFHFRQTFVQSKALTGKFNSSKKAEECSRNC